MDKKHTIAEYYLYDSKYYSNPKEATLYTMVHTLEEAKKEKQDNFNDAVIVEIWLEKNEEEPNEYNEVSRHII